MSYIVSTSILGIQTFVTRFDPSAHGSRVRDLPLSLRAWDCVASARRGLPFGRKIYLLTAWLRRASNPLHSGGSASRQPSSHSQHGITASNAALPSRKVEGLVGPLRPWSGSRSCGGPPRPRYTLCSHGSCADVRAKTVARGRTARVRLCPWILQAPTMSAAIGTKNKMRTRVERREKGSDPVPP